MTKLRKPLTIEQALDKAIGDLTMDGAVEATGRKASYLRALTDPEKRETLTVVDLVKLDTAHIAQDGTAPLLDAVTTIIKSVRASVFTDAAMLGDHVVAVMKENAEAECALFEASRPGADDAAWAKAERELAEALPKGNAVLAFIRQVREAREAARAPP